MIMMIGGGGRCARSYSDCHWSAVGDLCRGFLSSCRCGHRLQTQQVEIAVRMHVVFSTVSKKSNFRFTLHYSWNAKLSNQC